MRIIFFSDIHGNIEAINAFAKEISDEKYDKLIFCGDAVGYGYHADEVCMKLEELGAESVRGNHDQMMIDIIDGKVEEESVVYKYGKSYANATNIISPQSISILRNSKMMIKRRFDDFSVTVVHGSIDNWLNGRIYPDTTISNQESYKGVDYVFCGHTHHRMVRRFNESTIINVGSIGQPRDGNMPSYVLFDSSSGEIIFRDLYYSTGNIKAEIVKNEFPVMARKMIDLWERGSWSNDWN